MLHALALASALVAQPLKVPDTFVPEAAAASDEDVYRRVLTYREEHLEVRPLNHQLWAPPLVLSPDGASYVDRPGSASTFPTLVPMPSSGPDWGIVRGSAELLDDADLARLQRDEALLKAIEAARFWPRVTWAAGFGAAAAAGVSSGAWLTWQHPWPNPQARRDGRATGLSLLTVGITSAVLAFLYPDGDHYLSAHEATARCNDYNEGLRQELGLAPDDLRRF